jgi:ribosome-binding factor A
MSNFRMARVNAQVKKELGELVRQKLSVEEHGLITITDVEVSKDLRTANVYFSVVGVRNQEDEAIGALERIRKDLQSELSDRVKLKYTPQLSFKHDHSTERGIRVIGILDELDHPAKDEKED